MVAFDIEAFYSSSLHPCPTRTDTFIPQEVEACAQEDLDGQL